MTRLERIPRGRPITRYALSEAGEEERAAAHYQRLLQRLSPALVNLTPEEVRGQDGREILERVFDHVAASVADEHRGKVTSTDLEERVQQVLVGKTLWAGTHQVEFSPQGLASGIYFVRIASRGQVDQRRIVFVK